MNPFYLFLEKTEQIIGNQNGELVILCFAYYVDGRFLYVTDFFNRSYGFMVVCKSVHLYLVNQFFLGICSLVFSEILHMDYQWQTDFPEKILFALKWPPIFFEF